VSGMRWQNLWKYGDGRLGSGRDPGEDAITTLRRAGQERDASGVHPRLRRRASARAGGT